MGQLSHLWPESSSGTNVPPAPVLGVDNATVHRDLGRVANATPAHGESDGPPSASASGQLHTTSRRHVCKIAPIVGADRKTVMKDIRESQVVQGGPPARNLTADAEPEVVADPITGEVIEDAVTVEEPRKKSPASMGRPTAPLRRMGRHHRWPEIRRGLAQRRHPATTLATIWDRWARRFPPLASSARQTGLPRGPGRPHRLQS